MEIAAGAEIRYVEYVESVNSRGKYLKTYFERSILKFSKDLLREGFQSNLESDSK